MEIKIRDVNKLTIQKIDKLARERKLSRNQFLKMKLENMVMIDAIKDEYERFEIALNKVNEAIRLNHARLESLERGYEKLSMLITLASQISEDEVDAYLENKRLDTL